MQKNWMTKKEYITEHVSWSILLFLCWKNIFFRCIANYTYYELLLLFTIIEIVVVGIGILITWEIGRNYTNLATNIILSWGILAIFIYQEMFKQRLIIIVLITTVISFFKTLLFLCRKINRKAKKIFVIRNVANLWRKNMTCASLVILLTIAVSTLFGDMFYESNEDNANVKVYGEEDSLAANIETISHIYPERWKELDLEDRLIVCQKIVDVEARYYSISHRITVVVEDLHEGALACYNEGNYQIAIDIEHLKSSHSYRVLQSLLHECAHSYQWDQVHAFFSLDEKYRNLLFFYDISIYAEELTDYKNASDGFSFYYNQKVEQDARIAGLVESKEYIERVREYLLEIGYLPE